MTEEKVVKVNKTLNRIIRVQIIIIGLYILSLFTLLIEFNDAQRREILRYTRFDRIHEFTAEDCIEHFGEPLTISPNGTLLFPGGSSVRVGLGCEYYEYELWVSLDEEGKYVDSVRCEQIMEQILW